MPLFSCSSSGSLAEKDENGMYTISFGEGLPSYSSNVRYKEIEVNDEYKELYSMTNLYSYSDESILAIYRWKNDGKTLSEIMQTELDTYYPNSDYEYTELDNWKADGDYHFGYFMTYVPDEYEIPYYLQNFFFLDGDEAVEAQFFLPALRMELPINNWTIDLPLGYEDGSLIKTELSDDAIAKYVPIFEEEYPDINVYEWPDTYGSYKVFADDELSVRYNMIDYKIFDRKDQNGNVTNVLYSIYDENDEGTMETNYDLTIDVGDNYVSIDFFVLKDDQYIRYAIPAILSSITSWE